MEENGGEVNKITSGLFQDSDYSTQVEGTYRFALNAVNETDEGDNHARSNEESNQICGAIPAGFIPMGKAYMNNDRVALLLASENSDVSIIGIFDSTLCTFTIHVDDTTSAPKDKLNFSISKQIQVIYRLRLGCEDTIYWTDDNTKPKYFNFAKPDNFKKSNGTWASSKFNLQKTYEKIPEFSSLDVEDSGGNLPPGSVNVVIQYLDESFNPTEFMASSPVLQIYNDTTTGEFSSIDGSIQEGYPLDFPNTNKSISIVLSNLDNNFIFYRLGFVMATSGTGLVNNVYYSSPLSIHNNSFIFTGDNYEVKGTEEEVKQVEDFIERASIIHQIDNILLLGDTSGPPDNYCELQKFASQIKADCIVKDVVLNNINDPSNPKNPSHSFNGGIGYMPGEIYSIGIVYIFEDNSLSPAFHIAGKAPGDASFVFSPGVDGNGDVNVFPMSENNYSQSNRYIGITTCQSGDFWGLDYNGNTLLNKPVRHHRFPLRTEIGLPLIENTYGSVIYTDYYYLTITITGDLLLPIPCDENDPGCTSDEFFVFNFRVHYTVDGIAYTMDITVDQQYYADDVNSQLSITIVENTPTYSSNNIIITGYEVEDPNGVYQDTTSFDFSAAGYYNSSPSFSDLIGTSSSATQDKSTSTKILGLKLSNIIKPTFSNPNGKEVIGYYIVRNNKEESDKTILDSSVMFSTFKNKKYISSGILQANEYYGSPERQKRVFSFINPEKKFNGREYTRFDKLIHQGTYKTKSVRKGLTWYNDVHPGSSYNSEAHKKKHVDDGDPVDNDPQSRGLDGWSLALFVRDSLVDFHTENVESIDKADIDDVFYLDALENKPINNFKDEVFNVACDNNVGIFQTKSDVTYSEKDLKYMVMYKENKNPYSNFMYRPYYRETANPSYFTTPIKEEVIFNGDSYISPMRYNNSIFFDNRVANRILKNQGWKIVLGAILFAVGVIAAILLPGSGLPLATLGLTISVAAAGLLVANSGIKGININKAYGEAYQEGLRDATKDYDTFVHFDKTENINNSPFGVLGSTAMPWGKDGYSDDTIMWMNDCVTDLWFESSINFHLRNRFAKKELPTYLASPWYSESGRHNALRVTDLGDNNSSYIKGNQKRPPVSSLESNTLNKLLDFDDNRDDSRKYLGFALGEYYNVNKDYHRRNHQKVHFHLPLEYDCCSDCREEFPLRIRYSELSFQEELSDNYRILLPNNYKDIEGETGKLTNIFSLSGNLFAHTEEALWMLPRNYQERVTDQIVSFIGTGEFLSQPPRKIVDDDTGNSGGSRHKWGTVKTPSGIIFPSEHQNRIFLFDGQKLSPISELGLSAYFRRDLKLKIDEDYYKMFNTKYPYADNPSNPIGSGFISVYDSRKNRVLITKKDLGYDLSEAGETCINNGYTTYYPDMDEQIEEQEALGFSFLGINSECKLEFERITYTTERQKRMSIIVNELPSDLDIHFIYSNSGSFGSPVDSCLDDLITGINQWKTLFGNNNPSWGGDLYIHEASHNRWLQYPDLIAATYGGVTNDKKVLAIIVNNDGSTDYHSTSHDGSIPAPTTEYLADYNNFITNTYPSYQLFSAQIIPFVLLESYPVCSSTADKDTTMNNFKQVAASIWSNSPNVLDISSEFASIEGGMDTSEQATFRYDLEHNNPYTMTGLKDFGWSGYWGAIITSAGVNFPPENFNILLVDYFERHYEIEVISDFYFEVIEEHVEKLYLEGETFVPKDLVNNSWTMSFGLRGEGEWLSWHSFLPNFYIGVPESFSSWIYGNDNLWKHNKLGEYQKFYGVRYPFIMEIVSASNPLVTRIWDYLRLSTKSMKYDFTNEQFNDERFVTFNKAIFYNSRQVSGVLNLVVKDTNPNDEDYLLQQVQNLPGDSIIIDRNERDWTINQLRDNRVDYTKPMFNKNISSLQSNYYIDKIIDPSVIDYNKDWQDLESFRDKYLVIRLIFDNFEDVKLILNHSVSTETNSYR